MRNATRFIFVTNKLFCNWLQQMQLNHPVTATALNIILLEALR